MMKILILIFAIFAICYATPMREEILARLGQLSELKDQIAQAKEAFTKFHEVATQTHLNYREIITNSNSKRDARITQECSNALQNLASVYVNGSCPLYFAQYFNPTTSSSDKQTAVSNFCTNCQQPFNQAVNRVITACNFSDIDAAIARAAGFYPRFLCAKDSNNNFCANVLNDVVGNVPTDISQFTDATLVKVCAPCISIALNVLQQGNLVANAVYLKSVIILRGVCVTFKGKFCFAQIRDNYNGLIQIGAKFNSTNAEITAGDFKKILDFFCAPCYRLISARLALSNGISALAVLKAFSTVGSLCRKNAAKEYCLVKIFDLAKPFLAAGAAGGNVPCDNSFKGTNATCSDDCKNVVRNFVNKGGCCWAVLADAISGTGPGSDNTLKTQFYAAIKQCVPDLTLPEPCVSIAKAKIKITYTNLVLSVIAANQQAFITAALADLRVAIGGYDSVDNANIQVTTNKRAGEVVISVPVTTTGTLGDTLTYSETSCGNVCGSIAIQDPSQQVTVTSSTSDLSVQSSSSVLSFSFALLFILSLFFF